MVLYNEAEEEMSDTSKDVNYDLQKRSFSASYITKDVYLERLRKYVLLRAKEKEILKKSEEAARLVERVNLARERRHSVVLMPNECSRSAPSLGALRSYESMSNINIDFNYNESDGAAIRNRTSTFPKQRLRKSFIQPPPSIQVTPVVPTATLSEEEETNAKTDPEPHKLSPSQERILEAKKRWSLRVETMKALDSDIRKAKSVMARVRAVSLPQGLDRVGLEERPEDSRLQDKIYSNIRRPSLKSRSVSFM